MITQLLFIGFVVLVLITFIKFMQLKIKSRKEYSIFKTNEQKEIKKWEGLTIRLTEGVTPVFRRLDYVGDSLLIFINGTLATPIVDYKCFRENLIIDFPFISNDEIVVVDIENSGIKRITLNKDTYNKLQIQGDKKILEI